MAKRILRTLMRPGGIHECPQVSNQNGGIQEHSQASSQVLYWRHLCIPLSKARDQKASLYFIYISRILDFTIKRNNKCNVVIL